MKAGLTLCGCLGVAGAIWYASTRTVAATPGPLGPADAFAAGGRPKQAADAYAGYVASHANSPDPAVQDVVAAARIRRGYALAKAKDFAGARAALLEAEHAYRGTGKMSPKEGGAKDEAAYQAAVCLLALGKKDEAKRELLAFIDRYPDSPNTGGAYKRLAAMTTGKEREALDAKLDAIAAARGKREAIEMAKCGPRAVAAVAERMGLKAPDEATLVKICGTDATGTSLAGVKAGLARCGIQTRGLDVNRADFATLPMPAIWLREGHYFAVWAVSDASALCYDPLVGRDVTLSLPAVDDPQFRATVLALTDSAKPNP